MRDFGQSNQSATEVDMSLLSMMVHRVIDTVPLHSLEIKAEAPHVHAFLCRLIELR